MVFSSTSRFIINLLNADLGRNLISHSAEQWGVLAVIRVAIRHLEEFTILDGTNSPGASLLCLFEEDLVVFEATTSGFRLVEVSPDSGEHVRETENKEEPVLEVVEQDGCQKSDGKVGQAPDDNADSSTLGSCCSREDLRGNQL